MHNRTVYSSLSLSAYIVLLLAIFACDTTVATDKAEIGEAIEKQNTTEANAFYKIDTTQSEVQWIGAKITGKHNGLLRIQNGQLELDGKNLVGGNVLFDMKSTRSKDKSIDEASNKKLTTHLLSEDFFDVERYPTAEFEITGVVPFDSSTKSTDNTRKYSELRVMNPTHRLTGNLTIKHTKKSVTFPARITISGRVLKAKANFNIDRTQWGLIYRADESLGNQTIYPEVNINLDITAKLTSQENAL